MDKRNARDGQAIEEVGTYDPMIRDKSQRVSLKMERVDYWLSVGAQPTEKVAALIKKVKTNKFGTTNEPPPLTPPKQPPPPEPEAAEETPEADGESSAEEAQEESAATAEATETAAEET